MTTPSRRTFGTWMADVLCGLVAFVVAWTLRFGIGDALVENLPRDLITFVAVYLALRLAARLYSLQRDQAVREAAALKIAADVAKRNAPSPPPPTPLSPPRP
jgi:hypothetical protein